MFDPNKPRKYPRRFPSNPDHWRPGVSPGPISRLRTVTTETFCAIQNLLGDIASSLAACATTAGWYHCPASSPMSRRWRDRGRGYAARKNEA